MTKLEPAVPTAQAGGRRAWLGLGVLLLPVLLVSMDISVLFLAMPTLTADLDPSASQQLWILDIYGFMLAGLLITMGNLGDRIGRRNILLAGATVFGLASVLGAFAPNPEVLIAARVLMGIGGATLLPSSLALISSLFPDVRERATAIGIWTAFFAGGSAVGPIIGGVLLHHFWWGSVFLINIPVLAILLLFGPFLLPEHRSAALGPLDLPSVALSIGGILPVVYGIKHIAAEGFDITSLVIAAIGAVLLVVFVRRQRQLAEPLLDLSLFTRPLFRVAIGASLVGMMSLAALSYLTSVYLQSVTGRDPLQAALLGIPMAIAVFVFSMSGARVGRALGVRATFTLALAMSAVGNLMLLGVGVDGGLIWYLVGSAVAGIGYGISFTLVSDVAVSAVPAERAGSAVGISETSFELGNALGLALLGSVAALVFRSGGDFGDTLGETVAEAGGDTALIDAARASFVTGMHVATAGGALLLIAMAVLAWRSARGTR
ncbi:MFS transporter [Nocardia asteroides NBRC 15531]|uniref:Drug resistance transporter n=1 Tax=Nocardia asteroides NBRC 15531 TaxID=1110697 RepID=U5EE35_NOCAS|nr:MFS transporter [Nocardia asteroides]TLF67583.1 MFS transporter [Nocardia asteroides NBRC 15531]UGT50915.1 MFS transporter [Nocardia asteroides]SFN45340.1 MFS transporter, DHA2 family, multidrug resistance protein [Nocardia asteroides]VEG36232.1 Antiseptic resistance protein [Nocardia asteroides]GAD85605.1 putative drug resistance transporter [Nocardia asteroides NBRC 15531]